MLLYISLSLSLTFSGTWRCNRKTGVFMITTRFSEHIVCLFRVYLAALVSLTFMHGVFCMQARSARAASLQSLPMLARSLCSSARSMDRSLRCSRGRCGGGEKQDMHHENGIRTSLRSAKVYLYPSMSVCLGGWRRRGSSMASSVVTYFRQASRAPVNSRLQVAATV